MIAPARLSSNRFGSNRSVTIVPIDPAKLQDDADLCCDDEEVRHVAHGSEAPRPQGVDVFSEVVAQWLKEAYKLPAASAESSPLTTQTHTGVSHVDDAGPDTSSEATRSRTRSFEPELELESRPFLERSSIFLRLKQPLRWGRGYGARSQPFKPQDIHVWTRIKNYDWTAVMGDGIDPVSFINHWFETDFTSVLLERMFLLDPAGACFDDIIIGNASAVGHSRDAVDRVATSDTSHLVNEMTEPADFKCQVCKYENGMPTINVLFTPTDSQQSSPRLHNAQFCGRCRSSCHDQLVWLCQGSGSARCRYIMQMRDAPLGVPCCRICETVRYNYHQDGMFNLWSNIDEEPLPQRRLRG